jgi:hypothetical protein
MFSNIDKANFMKYHLHRACSPRDPVTALNYIYTLLPMTRKKCQHIYPIYHRYDEHAKVLLKR